MRSVINPNNIQPHIEITGPVAMYGLANQHISELIINISDRDPQQLHTLQDAKCDNLVIDKLIIRGDPDQTSKATWMVTDNKGAMIVSPGVIIKHCYVEFIHLPLQLIGKGSKCLYLETYNTSGDAWQLCGDDTRLEKADITGLLDVYPYNVEHQDVGMLFPKLPRTTLRNAYVGNVTLHKSGHPWENENSQGIIAPDGTCIDCLIENCVLPGVHIEHGVRFGHAINCTIKNCESNGAIAFGDRKPTAMRGNNNRIIDCTSPVQCFEDDSGSCTPTRTREGSIMQTLNRRVFFDSVRQSVFGGKISEKQVLGCEAILTYWEQHHPEKNREWWANSLATAYHESAHTMEAIKERGGNAYFTALYDINGDNPKRAKRYGNVSAGDGARFCGRGLVQVTWFCNYDKQGKKHGMDFVKNPDLLLHLETSVKVMIEAMIDGDFCYVKRGSSYYPASFDMFTADDGTFNKIEARRIVNGVRRGETLPDKAHLIAGYHDAFLQAITLAEANGQPVAERDEPVLHAEVLKPMLKEKPDLSISDDETFAELMTRFLQQHPGMVNRAPAAAVRDFQTTDSQNFTTSYSHGDEVYYDDDAPDASVPFDDAPMASKPTTRSKTIWVAGVTAVAHTAVNYMGESLGVPAAIQPHIEAAVVTAGLAAIGFIRKYFTNTVLK